MAGGGLLSGKLMAAYDTLIKAFQDAGTDANCGFVECTDPLVSCFSLTDDGSVIFNAFFHLIEWRAGNESIDILVHVQEMIERNSEILAKSTVHVSYFKVHDRKACLLHSIHFDYGKEEEAFHPRFHAQLCPEPVQLPADVAKKLEFEYELAPPGAAICFKDARIPTSDMTFPSVLLCLAADHLHQPFFSNFRESVLKLQENMPQPNFDSLRGSITANPEHLRSSHWFAHMHNPVQDNT